MRTYPWSAVLTTLVVALPLIGACSSAPGEDASQSDSTLGSTVDMATYLIPSCDKIGTAWQVGSEPFHVVPLGMQNGRGRFAIVKSAGGDGYEEWFIDKDWLRIRADTTWAYEINGGTWCDVKCGTNDGSNCQQRWNTNKSDPHNGLSPSSPWVYTLYSDPNDPNLAAPFIPRTMPLAMGGSYQFTATMKITGARRDNCATCSTNFDTKNGQTAGRTVTAHRYATWHQFSDVVQLHVDGGPGAGEDYFYARNQGWIGFNGTVASGPSGNQNLPQMLCGSSAVGSICSATGGSAPPPPAPTATGTGTGTGNPPPPPPPGTCACLTNVDNYCLYPKSTANCGMTAPGGYCDPNKDGNFSDADWVRGYDEYHTNCPNNAPPPPPPPPPPASCACKTGVDNYCLYGANVANCAMTQKGGYCDPNGDGSFSDADWVRGYNENHKNCP